MVAHLGKLDEAGRLGLKQAAEEKPSSAQKRLFAEPEPEWIEVDASAVRVENCRQFGGPWLALELIKMLRLDKFLRETIPSGREDVPWSVMALVLVIARLCKPSSELSIAENFSRKTALPDLLGVPEEKVYDNRLYRALDKLLPHKAELEVFLKEKLGELFTLEYDLLLYDVTSTYFEGEAKANPLAQRGYSRDKRGDCKQVTIGLVVSRCGMPLGYEVFAGNRADVTTMQQIVETMEARYGKSNRIWVMDRGMASEENIEFLKEEDRRYIVGTPKGMLKKFEQPLLGEDWHSIREGLEVKLCASPDDEAETFILCRSRDRREKEKAMHERFEKRIEQRLTRMAHRCHKQKRDPLKVGGQDRTDRMWEAVESALVVPVTPYAAQGERVIQKLGVVERFGADCIEDRSRIRSRGNFERYAAREVGLDQAGDHVDRGTLRGQDQVDAGCAGFLGQSRDRRFNLAAYHHHQIGEFIDDDDDAGKMLVKQARLLFFVFLVFFFVLFVVLVVLGFFFRVGVGGFDLFLFPLLFFFLFVFFVVQFSDGSVVVVDISNDDAN